MDSQHGDPFKHRQKKMLPRYIPQEVLHQLNHHLDSLPVQIKRMVILLQEWRICVSELCFLPFDCLMKDADGNRFLRYDQLKLQQEHIILVSDSAAAMIKEQQKALENERGGKMHYLFPNAKGQPLSPQTFMNILNRLACEKDIRSASGEIWRFQARQFRSIHITQMMDHYSSEWYAYHMSKDGSVNSKELFSQRRSANGLKFGYCTLPPKECPCLSPLRSELSQLNFGSGSISCVISSRLLKTWRINAFYKWLEKLDAIALTVRYNAPIYIHYVPVPELNNMN